MINLIEQTMGTNLNNLTPIERWEVWYITPAGAVKTIAEALIIVNELMGPDVNPNMYLAPIPVAINKDYYEIFRR